MIESVVTGTIDRNTTVKKLIAAAAFDLNFKANIEPSKDPIDTIFLSTGVRFDIDSAIDRLIDSFVSEVSTNAKQSRLL